jgi:hypothetical protein
MVDIDTIKLSVKEIERYGIKLIELIQSVPEDQLWLRKNGIPNSIGTLARHLTDNLNNYFGAGISKNGNIRDREKEFSGERINKEIVTSDLQSAINVAKESIVHIDPKEINLPYVAPFEEKYESLAYHIIRLATHFSLHYGQAEFAQTILKS